MIYDPTKDMTISYNHLNLPSTVDFGNGNSIEWTYDANGAKLRKEVTSGNTTIEDRHYIDAAEYNNGKLVQVMHDYGRVTSQQPCDDNQYVNGLLDNTSLYEGKHVISDGYVIPPGSTTFEGVESVLLTEDFEVEQGKVFEAKIAPCSNGNWEYQYRIGDHLDNTRIVFADQNNNNLISTTEIIQEFHYSPFGRALTGEWNDRERNDYDYSYNNKELIEEFGLGWMDYGARFYDPAIARFTSTDRFSEKYSNQSPYHYAANNPIRFIDINGDSIDVFAPDGSHLYTFDDGKKAVTGLYFQESESCKDGSCTYSGGVAFQYNDVSEDRGRALNGDFTFNVVSDDQINSIVSDGVAGAGSSPASHYRAGRAGGSIDFWGKDNSPIKSNTLNITTSARGGTVAYNSNDFGNYLTGQALRRLGYGVGEAQLGGHINNIINGPNDYGSREAAGWLDSRTDQRAIVNGYYHFTTKNRPLKLYNSYGVKYY